MELNFTKYHGTGNDFILIDNRDKRFPKRQEYIKQLCDRHFGIGADGLILLEDDPDSDFMMVYYNSDGKQSSMCGNGGRCIVHFANALGLIGAQTEFKAIDGLHQAQLINGQISLKMSDVSRVVKKGNDWILNTGSPHIVTLTEQLDGMDIKSAGAEIRYSEAFKEDGINVNFVRQIDDSTFRVRTYERGVENETLSCGTGVTAVALAMYSAGYTSSESVKILTEGGELRIDFKSKNDKFEQVILTGPAKVVFKGTI